MEKEILQNLLELMYKYSKVLRATATRNRYDQVASADNGFDYKHETLREPLIEHVGQLPIIATYLHPHIEKKDEVNLPRTLLMLAIHDIAETEMGDVPSSYKKEETFQKEAALSQKMIDPSQLQYFNDFEDPKDSTSLFARAVDNIAPFLNDMLLPIEATQNRLDTWGYTVKRKEEIKEERKKYFSWDPVLLNLFNLIKDDYVLRKEGKTDLDLDFINK